MKRSIWPMFASVVWLGIPQILATSVRSVNLVELEGISDRVFRGKCVKVEAKSDYVHGVPVVEYTFLVREGIKGVRTGQKVVFRQVRSGGLGRSGVPGVPEYRAGQDLVLFLHGESRLGLTSPVGLLQGAFEVKRTQRGELGLVNGAFNCNLTDRLSQNDLRRIGLSVEEANSLREDDPVPIRHFRSVVDKISRARLEEERTR